MTYLPVTENIQALLKRSPRRRTIGIRVHRGQVQVSAPPRAPLTEIQAFLMQKANWIRCHLQRQEAALSQREIATYLSGESVFFKGQALQIHLVEHDQTHRQGDLLNLRNPTHSHAERATELANWFIEQAAQDLPKRVEYWSRTMRLVPRTLKIRHYKTRWGSCDRRGGLQFNWLIMMAPEEVIDYVVVHEIAHLAHFDHSPRFWSLVAQNLPNYPPLRAWLKQQNHLIWHTDNC